MWNKNRVLLKEGGRKEGKREGKKKNWGKKAFGKNKYIHLHSYMYMDICVYIGGMCVCVTQWNR